MKTLHTALLAAAVLITAACSSKKATPSTFALEVRALTSEGAPLAGVAFSLAGKSIGLSGADGRVTRKWQGVEGAVLAVGAVCPAGYDAPPRLPTLRLATTRGIDGHDPLPIRAELRCDRRERDVVVVIKAERGARLPVAIDGKPVTTTNDDGIAHVLLHRDRSDSKLEVSLDTSSRAALRPVSPSRTYDLKGRDAVVLFDQTFVVAPKTPRAAPPRRHIPVRVD